MTSISNPIQTVEIENPACVVKVLRRDPGAKLSVLFPHKKTEINDEALAINLRALDEHTVNPIEVIVVEDPPGGKVDVYVAWNAALCFCTTPYMVFHNSDMIVGPWWDAEFVNHAAPKSILYNYLVEPGALGCHPANVHKNFGWCPRCFRRNEFDAFVCEQMLKTPSAKEEKGFAIQVVFPIALMNEVGRFPTDMPFMHRPNDLIMIEAMDKLGAKHYRVNSWAYHYQNLSHRRNACNCYEQKSSRPGEQP